MPKFKITVKVYERIKMTFIVDGCKGSLGVGGAGKQRQEFLDWQDWGFNGSNAEKDPGLQYT